MKKKAWVIFYILSSLLGAFGEFLSGWIFKLASGRFLWIYPESPLKTTSIIVVPLWGIVGLTSYLLWKKVKELWGESK